MIFNHSDGVYFPASDEPDVVFKTLPPGTYRFEVSMLRGPMFVRTENPSIPEKVYGNASIRTDRIVKTFRLRGKSTGVMMTGDKGSGKTVLAKMVAERLRGEDKIPTILVAEERDGAWIKMFGDVLAKMHAPVCVIFDEFEKFFNKDEQVALLSVLNGVINQNSIFLFTANDKWMVNPFLFNRPDRIYYYYEFGGIDADMVRGYCEDRLSDKSNVDKVCRLVEEFEEFNFDMLQGLVEEVNRYGEDPRDAIAHLNIRRSYNDSTPYKVEFYLDGAKVEEDKYTNMLGQSPLRVRDGATIIYESGVKANGDPRKGSHLQIRLADEYLVEKETSVRRGKIVYQGDNWKAVCKRRTYASRFETGLEDYD